MEQITTTEDIRKSNLAIQLSCVAALKSARDVLLGVVELKAANNEMYAIAEEQCVFVDNSVIGNLLVVGDK